MQQLVQLILSRAVSYIHKMFMKLGIIDNAVNILGA
jgi:hypothetical protein